MWNQLLRDNFKTVTIVTVMHFGLVPDNNIFRCVLVLNTYMHVSAASAFGIWGNLTTATTRHPAWQQ